VPCPGPARYVPHIYTDQELTALFAQTDRCRYCAQVPLRAVERGDYFILGRYVLHGVE
jgi:hypothetical protein